MFHIYDRATVRVRAGVGLRLQLRLKVKVTVRLRVREAHAMVPMGLECHNCRCISCQYTEPASKNELMVKLTKIKNTSNRDTACHCEYW